MISTSPNRLGGGFAWAIAPAIYVNRFLQANSHVWMRIGTEKHLIQFRLHTRDNAEKVGGD